MLLGDVVLQFDRRMKAEVTHIADVLPAVLMHLQMVVEVEKAFVADVAHLQTTESKVRVSHCERIMDGYISGHQ